MRPIGVSLKTLPVALKCEGYSLEHSHRCKDSPAAYKPRLPRRKPHIVDTRQAIIVCNITVNHALLRQANAILTQMSPAWRTRHDQAGLEMSRFTIRQEALVST